MLSGKWMAFTIDDDDDVVAACYKKRHGVLPGQIHRQSSITLAGPLPSDPEDTITRAQQEPHDKPELEEQNYDQVHMRFLFENE